MQRRGSVLIITLFIIMSLAGMTLDLSEESGISLTLCGISRDVYLARQAARAGVAAAIDRLASDLDREVDSVGDEWAGFHLAPLPEPLSEGVFVSGRIVDESGKLNLNTLVNEHREIDDESKARLSRLFRALLIEEQKAAPLLDWLDGDEIERMNGAESYYYRGLQEPYSCANGPLTTVGEAWLVKGMAEAFSGKDLRDYFTIYSDGKININTAPAEVLQTLSDRFDRGIAEAVVSYRKNRAFRKNEDLKMIPGMDDAFFSSVSPWITVKSTAFSIEAQGSCSGVSSVVRAVAKREDNGMKILYWKVQ